MRGPEKLPRQATLCRDTDLPTEDAAIMPAMRRRSSGSTRCDCTAPISTQNIAQARDVHSPWSFQIWADQKLNSDLSQCPRRGNRCRDGRSLSHGSGPIGIRIGRVIRMCNGMQ